MHANTLDLVQNWENGTIIREKAEYWIIREKAEYWIFFSNPCQSVRECPKILKICQITDFDMGFQKINMISRLEKVDFYLRRKLGEVSLKT
jgi:hypothetical protein